MLTWATGTLGAAGRRVTGAAEQRKTWNLAALFRLPTDKGPVWLKTTPRFAADEASAIAAFARADPTLVPPVIGAGPGRVLLEHLPGEDCWDASPQIIASAIQRMVAAQAVLAGRLAPGFLPPGLADRRAPVIAGQITALLDGEVAGELSAGEVAAARGLLSRFPRLDECGLPDTIVHGDFHSGNWRSDDGLDLCHVAPGGRGGLVRVAPGFARDHVRRVPVPPVVRRGDGLERAVMQGRLVQQISPGGDVRAGLPFPAGEPGRDLLEQPAVAIRVAERRVRGVRAPPLRVGPRDARVRFAGLARLPLVVVHLADVHAAADEIGPGSFDVLDGKEHPVHAPGSDAVRPVPKWIEHPEWGGVNCTIRKSSPTARSASSRQPRL